MKTLIVIDMQNDFIDGALGTPEAQAIVPNVKKKLEEYKANGHNILFTRDTHYAGYLNTQEGKYLPVPHCIQGTPGWCISTELGSGVGYDVVDKRTFGYETLRYHIDDSSESIELVGVCTDICVVSNALILKAQFPETKIIVDASCCAGVTPEKHKAALEVMKSCQIEVIGE
jgi:nicotinamidase-related amidase